MKQSLLLSLILTLALVATFGVNTATAAPLKVDIGQTDQNVLTGWEEWSFGTTTSDTRQFSFGDDTLDITISSTNSTNFGAGGRYGNVNDMIDDWIRTDAGTNEEVAIEIAGLSDGEYTLKFYTNNEPNDTADDTYKLTAYFGSGPELVDEITAEAGVADYLEYTFTIGEGGSTTMTSIPRPGIRVLHDRDFTCFRLGMLKLRTNLNPSSLSSEFSLLVQSGSSQRGTIL